MCYFSTKKNERIISVNIGMDRGFEKIRTDIHFLVAFMKIMGILLRINNLSRRLLH